MRQANAKNKNSIMIGDCIQADVLGAMNCGMDAILFSEIPQIIESKNIKQINHLLKLKKHL
jgi:predicted HAD superfamily phosphohydrolase YqeG